MPTAKVVKGPLKLTVYATGELRAGRTVNLMAPPAGGSLRIVKLLPTGTSGQEGRRRCSSSTRPTRSSPLEQAKSDLAEAEQQIVKMKADTRGAGLAGQARTC